MIRTLWTEFNRTGVLTVFGFGLALAAILGLAIALISPQDAGSAARGVVVVTAIAGAAWHGRQRVVHWHPACRSEYLALLRASPWTPASELPFGSTAVTARDLFLLAFLSLTGILAAGYEPPGSPTSPPVFIFFLIVYAFYLPYCFGLLFVPHSDGRLHGWRAAGFIVAAACFFLSEGSSKFKTEFIWIACLLPFSLYPFLRLKEKAWLAEYPWPQFESGPIRPAPPLSKREEVDLVALLFGIVTPRTESKEHPGGIFDLDPPEFAGFANASDVLLSSILVGLIGFAFMAGMTGNEPQPGDIDKAVPGFVLAACAACALRAVMYLAQAKPPISLWGRLATGRIIILGYDVIFLAPLAGIVLALLLPEALSRLGLRADFAVAVMLFVVSFVIQALGPRLRAWHLTGDHHLGGSRALAPKTKL